MGMLEILPLHKLIVSFLADVVCSYKIITEPKMRAKYLLSFISEGKTDLFLEIYVLSQILL